MSDKKCERVPVDEPLESLVSGLGTTVAEGLVRGLEESELLNRVMETLMSMQQRLNRVEKEIAKVRSSNAATPVASAAVLRPAVAAEAAQKSKAIAEAIVTQLRKKADESSEGSKICADPGCERPARSKGLCSAHYQRLRYRERKTEHQEEAADPLPPPAPLPASHPAAVQHGKGGGTRGIFALLYEERGRRLLAGLINQTKFDRRDLVQRLNDSYQGVPGMPLEEEDVLRAIHFHKLGETLFKRESEVICRNLRKQRGSLGKAAQALKIGEERLRARIQELGLEDEVSRIRNEFREVVLETASFRERLDLALTREKYLVDLGIEKEVDASLRRDLDAQLLQVSHGATPEVAALAVRRALALDEELYRRLVKRFGLESSFQPEMVETVAVERR